MADNEIVVKFTNCYLLREGKLKKEDLWVCGGKIVDPEPLFFDDKIGPDRIVDCGACLIAPGLIDLQINGGFGVDFSFDITDEQTCEESLTRVAKGLLAHGVTSFCPTVVTSPSEVYKNILKHFRKRKGSKAMGANVLGLHIEGPFISTDKRGAHPIKFIKTLEHGFQTVKDVIGEDWENVDIVTIAPELNPSGEVVRKLKDCGVKVSLGHSTAKLEDGERAVNQGASLITHLFNAMSSFHHRDPGLVGLLTTNRISADNGQKVFYGIIADGIHAHQATIKLAYKANFEAMCLITDGIGALGLDAGNYALGQQVVEVKQKKAVIAGTDILCGAIGTLWDAVKNVREWTNCSVVDALEAASLHPAQALGIQDIKGCLEFGADADFIMIDSEDMNELLSTYIGGECVYKRGG